MEEEAGEYSDSCVLSGFGWELIGCMTDIPMSGQQLNMITGEKTGHALFFCVLSGIAW